MICPEFMFASIPWASYLPRVITCTTTAQHSTAAEAGFQSPGYVYFPLKHRLIGRAHCPFSDQAVSGS